jgi:hypothetical protein
MNQTTLPVTPETENIELAEQEVARDIEKLDSAMNALAGKLHETSIEIKRGTAVVKRVRENLLPYTLIIAGSIAGLFLIRYLNRKSE